jgi:sarcosine oxidase subunit beta
MESVVIIGGGIIGTSIAYQLRSSDLDVSLIEKDMIGAGTTAKSAAMLTHHQEEPKRETYDLREDAWNWYEKKIKENVFEFDQIGTLHTATSKAELESLQEMESSYDSFGLDVEILSPAEIADFNITNEDLLGGLWFPEDGVLDPGEIVQFFAEEAQEAGVDIQTGVEVTDIETSDGEVSSVKTNEGTQDASIVINAAGPWVPQVNDLVGLDIPVRHTNGPIIVLQAEDPISLPFTFFEEGIYLREEGISQVFAGSLMTEYEQSKVLNPNYEQTVDESMYLTVAEVAEKYLDTNPELEIVNDWNGLRTVTPDGRSIVSETPVDGYLLACGMSGYGVTIAPAIGKLVAQWITSGKKPDQLESLSLSRFEDGT